MADEQEFLRKLVQLADRWHVFREGRDGPGAWEIQPGSPLAEASGRQIGRPVARSEDKIEYARLLKAQGDALGVIAAESGIPKTSRHRYLATDSAGEQA